MAEQPEWYGKRPDKAAPLTDEWIRSAHASGSLVSPLDNREGRLSFFVVFGFIAAGVIAFLYGLLTR